jgi:hypothetical protein
MDWLETVAGVAVGWTALSVALVVAWSRFMNHVARKELYLTRTERSTSPASLESAYQTAAW